MARPATAGRRREAEAAPARSGDRAASSSRSAPGLHVFAIAPQHHYLARLIERPEQERLPPDLRCCRRAGRSTARRERLLRDEKIDVVVSKNSGGDATYAKIEAARSSACRWS
jgi:precorrin-6A/cobalt-precorrin-6A reductase